jgi:hypothetical protein
MRQGSRRSLITVAAASGALATLTGGAAAYADSGAQGGAANSPGVASGNNVQVPVHVPVNVCGNTVDVVGLLNPAAGNRCKNGGHGKGKDGHGSAGAQGGAHHSPGVGSGNNVQVPVDVPVNACGNSVDAGSALNPALGNRCADESPGRPTRPGDHAGHRPSQPGPHSSAPHKSAPHRSGQHGGAPQQPAPAAHSGAHARSHSPAQPQRSHHQGQSRPEGQLAQTGGGSGLGVAGPLGAGLLVGGYVLYRRARVMRG